MYIEMRTIKIGTIKIGTIKIGTKGRVNKSNKTLTKVINTMATVITVIRRRIITDTIMTGK